MSEERRKKVSVLRQYGPLPPSCHDMGGRGRGEGKEERGRGASTAVPVLLRCSTMYRARVQGNEHHYTSLLTLYTSLSTLYSRCFNMFQLFGGKREKGDFDEEREEKM